MVNLNRGTTNLKIFTKCDANEKQCNGGMPLWTGYRQFYGKSP